MSGLNSILKVVQGWIKIKGDSDGTFIGNVSDRLKVDATLSQVPTDKVVYFERNLENGGSPDMDVNGSVTPVEFTAGPPGGETWYVFEYGISLEDGGNNTISSFGAITNGLTNGFLIEQTVSSTDYQFKNIKTNLEMVEAFTDHSLRGQANSFLNATNFFTGKLELRQPVILIGDNNDVIKVTVQDNLTGINILRFLIEAYKVV